MRCSLKARASSKDFNNTYVLLEQTNTQYNIKANLFGYTEDISTTGADAVGECYTTAFSVRTYIRNKAATFGSISTFMASFL